MSRILIIEDDPAVLTIVEQGLKFHNHVVETAEDGTAGLELLLGNRYDLAIIDWELPGIAGVEICNRYRRAGGEAAILFLTGKSQVSSKVQAFDCGADDYLTKPFSYAELLVRVKALLRRPPSIESKEISYGGITLNTDSGKAEFDGAELNLSAGEFALLELFLRNPGRFFSASELLDRVFRSESDPEAVRQRIMRLRKKLPGEDGQSRIVNVKGFGYKLE